MSKSTKAILTNLGACPEAVEWAKTKSHEQAWETCKRGDWLLWVAEKFGIDRKSLVLAACACARTALKYVPKSEERPRLAIEAAEKWAKDPTEKNRAAAGAAAWAAAWAAARAAGAAAETAARTAAWAAARDAAWAAAEAARSAEAAAEAAAWAAEAAVWAARAARAAAHKRMAGIIRKIIPFNAIKTAIADYEGKA